MSNYKTNTYAHIPAQIPLLLNTRDSKTPEPWRPYFVLQHFALSHLPQQSTLEFEGITFPNVVYPINEYYNTIYFSEDGGTTTLAATLTHSNYTGTTIATELQTKMNNVGAWTYTVTYSGSSKKMTVSVVGGSTEWVSGENSLFEHLGIVVPSSSAFTSFTSEHPINISGTSYIDVISDIPTHSHSSTHNTNILIRIPLEQPFGNTVIYTPDKPPQAIIDQTHLQQFSMELRDDRGNPFKLPPNAHVSFKINIYPK